ncbi:MAG TPA: hypothetical protein DCQ31_17725 [Bacteroidales bacterium]|nr:hypothetical protein [Bacteroidales bacterium]
MFKFFLIPGLLIFQCYLVLAQHALTDTIELTEVTIQETSKFRPNGFKVNILENAQIENKRMGTLEEILRNESGISFKSYGAGKLASIGIRGSAASDVQVVWNGMKINSLFTGQTDFSSIPVLLADKISIVNGNTNFGLNSGAIGGSILLSSEPDFTVKFNVKLYAETGTYQNFRNGIALGGSYKKLVTKLVLYQNSADYTGLLSANGTLGGKLRNYGLIQETYTRFNKIASHSLNLWLQRSYNQLSTDEFKPEFQNEQFLRMVSNVKIRLKSSNFLWISAFNYSYLNYLAPTTAINSKNKLNTVQNTLEVNGKKGKNFAWRSGVNYDFYTAESNNFVDRTTHFILNTYSGANLNLSKAIGLYLFTNFEYAKNFSSALQPTLGFNYKINERILLKTNISQNRKTPSLNDLYWIPGGNPALLPEKGITGETGFVYDISNKNEKLSIELTGFYGKTENRIIWVPLPGGGIWSPINIEELRNSGLELAIKGKFETLGGKLETRLNLNYTNALTYNRTQLLLMGKQAIFVPKASGSHWVQFNIKDYSLWFEYSYVGKRYVTRDNSDYLPQNMLFNIGNSYRFTLKNTMFHCGFEINNLLNSYYEMIPNHPLAGRAFNIKLSLQYATK